MTTPASSISISVSDPVLADLMDQLANRLQAGEPLDVEDFLRAHPERSEELRRLLPAVEILADLERSVDGGAISFASGIEPSGCRTDLKSVPPRRSSRRRPVAPHQHRSGIRHRLRTRRPLLCHAVH